MKSVFSFGLSGSKSICWFYWLKTSTNGGFDKSTRSKSSRELTTKQSVIQNEPFIRSSDL